MEVDLTLDSNILSMPLDKVFIALGGLTLRKIVQMSMISKLHSDVVLLYLHHHPERVIERDRKGKTLFHYACKANYTEMINSLIFLAPCILFIRDNTDKTPIDYVDNFLLKNMLNNHDVVKSFVGLASVYDKMIIEQAKNQKLNKRKDKYIHNPTPYPVTNLADLETPQSAFMMSIPNSGSYIVSPVGSITVPNPSVDTAVRHPTPFDYENISPKLKTNNTHKWRARLTSFFYRR
jgi:hypothetical protein